MKDRTSKIDLAKNSVWNVVRSEKKNYEEVK